MAEDAVPKQVVRVSCQGKIIGEMVFKKGKLWRRDKALLPTVILMVIHMFTKEEFDWGHFEWSGLTFHYKVADYDAKLAVG